MRRYGIHLNALRAFEAAARLSSFSQAGLELHVSHSTISHHIKGLEETLGTTLFVRKHRTVTLTSEAEKLYLVLNSAFDDIALALADIEKVTNQEALKVTVTPSFANKWLVPKLRLFRDSHPDITVQIKPSLDLHDFNLDNLDIGIRNGLGKWPGLKAELLMPVHMTPLCSPQLVDQMSGSLSLDDLSNCTLIHADVSRGTGLDSEWEAWLIENNMPDLHCKKSLSFQDPALAIQAAIDGLGIAMGYLELASDDVCAGRLVQPFEKITKHPWSYYIVTPEGNVGDARSDSFCRWLRNEIKQ